jgi:hypothetical protein
MLIKIDKEIVSSSTGYVELTGMTNAHDVYLFTFNNVTLSVDERDLRLRFLESGTVNETANYDYGYNVLDATSNSEDPVGTTNQTSIDLTLNTGTGTSEMVNGFVYIFSSQISSQYTYTTMETSIYAHTARGRGIHGGGIFTQESTVNGFRLLNLNSANILTGTFNLYGLKK